jgi:hypothetical protein
MHPQQSTPTRVSNEEFAVGALYPGGRGIVKSCRYQLHDYNGKQAKDSNCGIFITFQPTDGSNEGKPTELFWNVGPAVEFIPDMASQGGFCLALHGRTGISDSSNCSKYLINKLKSTCGLPKGKLDEGAGVHVLEGSEIMFAQQDQEDRDFQDRQPGQAASGQGQRKNKVYVPTYAKFAWETGARAGAPMPQAQAQVPSNVVSMPATNGTAPSGISPDLANILKSIGTVDLSSNPAKSVLDYCVANNINNPARMPIVKEATALFKDAANLEVIAAGNGWTVSGGILMAG